MYGATPQSNGPMGPTGPMVEAPMGRRPSAQRQAETTDSIQVWVYIVAAIAALNSCSLGFDLGINTYVGPLLEKDLHLSTEQFQFFMGMLPMSSVFGCAFSSTICDTFGRRATFVTANVSILVGLIVILGGSAYAAVGSVYGTMVCGRALVGVGVGVGLVIGPLYLAEISPPEHRGWLVSWSEISICIGFVLAYSVGWACTSNSMGWDYMFASACIMPCLVLVFAPTVMLESPRWLVSKDRNDEAEAVIRKLFGAQADVSAIVREISTDLTDDREEQETHSWSSILCPSEGKRWPIVVGVVCGISQQLVGIEPMFFYMQVILRSFGEDPAAVMTWFPLVTSLVKLAVTVVAGRFMDIYGRRALMIISFGGMGVTCLCLAGMFYSSYVPAELIMKGFMSYAIFFSLGAGPGAWLLTSELFPNKIRAKGMSLAAVANRSVGAIEVSLFLTTVQQIGMGNVFAFWGVTSLLYMVFFYICLPETTSRTLEEISDQTKTLSFADNMKPNGSHKLSAF